MEQMKGNTASSEIQGKKWNTAEISKYFLVEYFKQCPESAVEKASNEMQLLTFVLGCYDKCCELLEKESEESETLRIARKKFKWNIELSSMCSIKEVTYASETLLLEYEICSSDVGDTEMREVKPTCEVDEEESEGATRHRSEKYFLPASVPECVQALVMMHYHVDQICSSIHQKYENLPKEFFNYGGKTDNMETEDSKTDVLPGKTDAVVKRLNNRMKFTVNLRILIRAALVLFKRLNPKWINSEEEKALEATAKRNAFASIKVASTDSSASIDNPPSIASSSDNPPSVPSFSDNPPSVPSFSDNPPSVPSFSDNPPSVPSFSDNPPSVPSFSDNPPSVPSFSDNPPSVPSFSDNPPSVPSFSDNPPSVPSSTDNPPSVASFSDNPPSVASSTDNPSSVPSYSDNPSSIASSSGAEAGELSSVERCPMEVDT